MKKDAREFLIAFNMVPGIGGRRLLHLKKYFGSLEKAWRAPAQELLKVPGFGEKTVASLRQHRGTICPATEEKWAKAWGARIVTIADPEYPQFLERLFVPPPTLYVAGKLPWQEGIAVVGTRRPSATGISQARKFSRFLARQGLPIISGLARGIDYFAHRSALQVGGLTVAVLGSNFANIYPPEHSSLVEKISEKGAVVTEFSSRSPILPGNFPRRNRIIAGLSQAVLVVQAGKKSGAINTANWGLELGLDVWAIPGNIEDPLRQGTNDLIKEGAFLASNAEDLLSIAALG